MRWWEMAVDNCWMNKTDVAIVGGGPAGLMLAIELGCRGIDCVLLETNVDAPAFPKANATSSRTMEHYRRRGLAKAMRSVGLVADHPQDIVYCTRLSGRELTRFVIPSRADALHQTSFGDYGEDAWPTPELPHRGQQMFIEHEMRAQAQRYPSVKLLAGWRGKPAAYSDALAHQIKRTYPQIGNVKVEHAWSGVVGHTVHGFTNPARAGMYSPVADARPWQSMRLSRQARSSRR